MRKLKIFFYDIPHSQYNIFLNRSNQIKYFFFKMSPVSI